MHHHAKFRQNPSIHCRLIVIFLFFKMADAAVLDFRNSQILLAQVARMTQMNHHAKFRQNLSFHCRVIEIFRFLKMAAAVILDF